VILAHAARRLDTGGDRQREQRDVVSCQRPGGRYSPTAALFPHATFSQVQPSATGLPSSAATIRFEIPGWRREFAVGAPDFVQPCCPMIASSALRE
jgi:hypothetical protein